ncbi:MAG: U6 snRNA-associated Sm-like protein LSm6 [Conexivisphaerales archaeon]
MNEGAQNIKRPIAVLQRSINKPVRVRLKNSEEYRGNMVNIDAYMNVFLEDAAEYDDKGDMVTNYGRVVIRGNNVLFVLIEDTLKI